MRTSVPYLFHPAARNAPCLSLWERCPSAASHIPLPPPLGEVSERSEDGEGQERRYRPSQSASLTALPKGEPGNFRKSPLLSKETTGGASPSPTLRRNVQQLGNMRPFSSSGASRHLPHMGKAGAILIPPAPLGCWGASMLAARHISHDPPPRPRRRGRTRCRCRHFCRRRCRCRRGRR